MQWIDIRLCFIYIWTLKAESWHDAIFFLAAVPSVTAKLAIWELSLFSGISYSICPTKWTKPRFLLSRFLASPGHQQTHYLHLRGCVSTKCLVSVSKTILNNIRMHISVPLRQLGTNCVNSLWRPPNKRRYKMWWTLIQVTAGCRQNQCYVNRGLWYSLVGNFTGNAHYIYHWYEFENESSMITIASASDQWVKFHW